jgi:hypothetical protein
MLNLVRTTDRRDRLSPRHYWVFKVSGPEQVFWRWLLPENMPRMKTKLSSNDRVEVSFKCKYLNPSRWSLSHHYMSIQEYDCLTFLFVASGQSNKSISIVSDLDTFSCIHPRYYRNWSYWSVVLFLIGTCCYLGWFESRHCLYIQNRRRVWITDDRRFWIEMGPVENFLSVQCCLRSRFSFMFC